MRQATEDRQTSDATQAGGSAAAVINDAGGDFDLTETLRELEEEMLAAANNLEFEKAALLRDQVRELKRGTGETTADSPRPLSYGKGKATGRGR